MEIERGDRYTHTQPQPPAFQQMETGGAGQKVEGGEWKVKMQIGEAMRLPYENKALYIQGDGVSLID